MKVSVLIPSYRRPLDLRRCLQALQDQLIPAEQIVVVARVGDEDTWGVLAQWSGRLPITSVEIDVPGVVQAMNAGLKAVKGDVVAITDDDAAPWPDWLTRIRNAFESDSLVAGVGGRDRIHEPGGSIIEGSAQKVGILSWFGRATGNHHIGTGLPRRVHVLKGVNCAYRMSVLKPIGFDTRLLGSGAQVHWELSLGLTLIRSGWRLVYDPSLVVEHYLSKRHDSDQRGGFNEGAFYNMVFNETYSILKNVSSVRRYFFIVWSLVIGHRAGPGIIQAPRLRLLLSDRDAWKKFTISLKARFSAILVVL